MNAARLFVPSSRMSWRCAADRIISTVFAAIGRVTASFASIISLVSPSRRNKRAWAADLDGSTEPIGQDPVDRVRIGRLKCDALYTALERSDGVSTRKPPDRP